MRSDIHYILWPPILQINYALSKSVLPYGPNASNKIERESFSFEGSLGGPGLFPFLVRFSYSELKLLRLTCLYTHTQKATPYEEYSETEPVQCLLARPFLVTRREAKAEQKCQLVR